MKVQTYVLAFAALVAASLPAFARNPQAGPPQAPAAAQSSIFGAPLVVNGWRVPEDEIKRYLIYGPCRLLLEMYRVNLIIDDDLDRRAREAAGTPGASEAERAAWQAARQQERRRLEEALVPTDEDVAFAYDRKIDEFRRGYPLLDVEAEISRFARSPGWWRQNLRQTLYFDRVFLPENPEDWPVVTIEAFRADSGDTLIDDAKSSYVARREHADKTGEPLPQDDAMLIDVHRQIVRDALFGLVDFKTAFDGLPPELVLTADKDGDGKPDLSVTTAEVWSQVADTVTQVEIDEAKQWFVTMIATRDRLREDNALLDDEQRRQAVADFKKQFEGSYFTIDNVATQIRMFPSPESFLEHYCLLEGFSRMLAPQLAAQESGDLAPLLRGYLDRANRIMGLGQVDVEILLVSAFDIPLFRWKPGGWEAAKAKVERLKAQIDANVAAYNLDRARATQAKAEGQEPAPGESVPDPYRFWSQLVDEHSEYWDPPPPEGQGKRASDVGMKNKGRFGPRYRNDLVSYVGETEFSHWVTGQSLTDFTFFDQAEGTVAGPFKGPLGYYLTRVQRRMPPSRPLNLGDPKHVELLKNDYLRVAFVEYAREARKAAKVEGFDFGY